MCSEAQPGARLRLWAALAVGVPALAAAAASASPPRSLLDHGGSKHRLPRG
jgi:hypothetical protein